MIIKIPATIVTITTSFFTHWTITKPWRELKHVLSLHHFAYVFSLLLCFPCFAQESKVKKETTKLLYLGDANGDGEINVSDLTSIANYILYPKNTKNLFYQAADINQDGIINVTDLSAVANNILSPQETSKITATNLLDVLCVEVDDDGESLYASYLADDTTEITYWFKKCMNNKLYTFYQVGYRNVNRKDPDTGGIVNFQGIMRINSTESDNIGPINMHRGGVVDWRQPSLS